MVLGWESNLDLTMMYLEQLMGLLLLKRRFSPFNYFHGPFHIFKLLVFQSNVVGNAAGRLSCF